MTGATEKVYQVGDTVWYIPGHSNPLLLAIRCRVVEVNDQFHQQDSSTPIYYWLDEPVGHAVSADQLFDTREQAGREMARRLAGAIESFGLAFIESLDDLPSDLAGYRHYAVYSSKMSRRQQGLPPLVFDLAEKAKGQDWFTLDHA
jgi:hypothetical protein